MKEKEDEVGQGDEEKEEGQEEKQQQRHRIEEQESQVEEWQGVDALGKLAEQHWKLKVEVERQTMMKMGAMEQHPGTLVLGERQQL